MTCDAARERQRQPRPGRERRGGGDPRRAREAREPLPMGAVHERGDGAGRGPLHHHQGARRGGRVHHGHHLLRREDTLAGRDPPTVPYNPLHPLTTPYQPDPPRPPGLQPIHTPSRCPTRRSSTWRRSAARSRVRPRACSTSSPTPPSTYRTRAPRSRPRSRPTRPGRSGPRRSSACASSHTCSWVRRSPATAPAAALQTPAPCHSNR